MMLNSEGSDRENEQRDEEVGVWGGAVLLKDSGSGLGIGQNRHRRHSYKKLHPSNLL